MLKANFVTKVENLSDSYGKFVIEPLPQSFGHSMGLALRRTLLSSIEGAAITEVRMEGVVHQFSTIKGVKESVLDILLNLKKLYLKPVGEPPYTLKLEAKGKGKVYAKDLKGNVEIINGDELIATLTDDKAKLVFEAKVEKGIGYRFVEDIRDKEYGVLYLDVFFSPVEKVNFEVGKARVGRKSDYDKLILEVWTNGAVSPDKAVREASEILAEHFARILSGEDKPVEKPQKSEEEIEKEAELKKLSEIIIDELDLPSRIINALLRENIETVGDLLKAGRAKLEGMKGLGKKSIELIDKELEKLGYKLE